ncbi:hypothetical protein [Saccharopolyspora sp. NPDC002686]|uniref:hypothetical protein n=1 Tax=Saccharopolyspora sp. NPDC002686 TaxID=3154541 RepID=UPI0033294009
MLADDVLAHGGLESWLPAHKTALTRVHTVYCDLSNAELNDFAVLSVGVQAISEPANACVATWQRETRCGTSRQRKD